MIQIDFNARTYVCPFCGHAQAFTRSCGEKDVGLFADCYPSGLNEEKGRSCLRIRWFTCSNRDCGRTCITAISRYDGAQQDIYPIATYQHYPEYIPLQIRSDYAEACHIIGKSPKAAATLFRRCLQGMIRDFWGVSKSRLVDEIESLKDKVPAAQWRAIDALRQLGNIGAHMEKDVNVIVEIDEGEALKLRCLIELLLDKWYISRHQEELLYSTLTTLSEEKRNLRVKN